MAAREASIRVNMKSSGYLSGLRQISDKTKRAATGMGTALRKSGKSLKAGLDESKKALADLGSGIKSSIKGAASLGGAISGGAMIHNAIQLKGLYSQIAFEMERATGKAFSAVSAQEAITKAADKTKRTHQEMATAMRVMLDRGADPKFAIRSMESVGKLMNVTGQDAERVGRVLSGLSNKYGISGRDAVSMLDGIVNTASRGKIQMEEYMEDFNEFGSIAQAAGLKGKGGLSVMLKMIEEMGPKVNGTTSEISSGMDIFFERLRDVGIIERIAKEAEKAGSKFKFKKENFAALTDARSQLEHIAKMGPEAMKLFAEEFTGREEKAAFDAFLGPYFGSLKAGLESGKKKHVAHLEALEKMKVHQTDMTTPMKEQARVSEQSARIQKGAAAKMREAMNTISKAITTPEMLEALDSMAESLPPLASSIAKALEFIVKNPLTSMAMFGGAKIGLAFGQGALIKAGTTIGTAAAVSIRTKAAAAGAWGVAGRALGVAAGAAIAFYIGKKAIDAMYAERGKEHGAAIGSEASAFSVAVGRDAGKKKSALADVRQKIATMKAKQGSFSGQVSDTANQTFGALAGAFGMSDNYVDTRADAMAKLESAEAMLIESINKQNGSTVDAAASARETASAMRENASATKEATKAMKKMGGKDGPPGVRHTGPGHAQ